MTTTRSDEVALATTAPPTALERIEVSKAVAQVQAMATLAKQFPRDETAAYSRIMKACSRTGLAVKAVYRYPRGKTDDGRANIITGPSIRLAEVLAQAWGNILFGWAEIERKRGSSSIKAFAWDVETNTMRDLTFIVEHLRQTKTASYPLTDPRDIYEMCANQAQRRVRSSILSIIPKDIIDDAVAECAKTEAKGDGAKGPLTDRVRKAVAAFNEFGVPAEKIAAYLGHDMNLVTEEELVELRQIYTTIKDGEAKAADYFDAKAEDAPKATAAPGKGVAGLKNDLGAQRTGASGGTAGRPASGADEPKATQATMDAIEKALANKDPATWALAIDALKPHTTILEDMTETEAKALLAYISKKG